MTRKLIAVLTAAGIAVLAAGCGGDDEPESTTGSETAADSSNDGDDAPAEDEAEPADEGDSDGPPAVADLMASAGCDGDVIDSQLYTRETGRCTIDGVEVDVAVFDDNERRDEWAASAEDVGATVETGELFAVSGFGADGPDAFMSAING